MVKMMLEALTTLVEILVSVTMLLLTRMPTLVRCEGSVAVTKPLPVSTTEKVEPGFAVGMLAGLMEVMVASAESTVTLKVVTICCAGLPQVMVTVPVKVVPGWAAAKIRGSNVTGICVPKL